MRIHPLSIGEAQSGAKRCHGLGNLLSSSANQFSTTSISAPLVAPEPAGPSRTQWRVDAIRTDHVADTHPWAFVNQVANASAGGTSMMASSTSTASSDSISLFSAGSALAR